MASGGHCCVFNKTFIAQDEGLYLSWSESDSAKLNGSKYSGSSHWVKRRTRSCSVLPLLLVMDRLRGTTRGLHRYSNFFFGNFIVRRSAFWVCCYRCSQLMFWHCSWQAWFSRALLGENPWKPGTFYALFLLVYYIAEEGRWRNYAFKKHGTSGWRKEVTSVYKKNLSLPGFPVRKSSVVYAVFTHKVWNCSVGFSFDLR